MEVVRDRPAPGVRDDDALDPGRLPAREVEADRAAPVRQEQGHVAKVEVIEKGGKPVRVAFGVVIFTPVAS